MAPDINKLKFAIYSFPPLSHYGECLLFFFVVVVF